MIFGSGIRTLDSFIGTFDFCAKDFQLSSATSIDSHGVDDFSNR
jgi:hypothetical protein